MIKSSRILLLPIFIKVNFDTAFVMEQCRSGTGLVARNCEGVVIASKAVVHDNVGSAFAGEALTCLIGSVPDSTATTLSDDWLREPD